MGRVRSVYKKLVLLSICSIISSLVYRSVRYHPIQGRATELALRINDTRELKNDGLRSSTGNINHAYSNTGSDNQTSDKSDDIHAVLLQLPSASNQQPDGLVVLSNDRKVVADVTRKTGPVGGASNVTQAVKRVDEYDIVRIVDKYELLSMTRTEAGGHVMPSDQLLSPDTALLGRIPFLPNYKNPCFYLDSPSDAVELRCLPYFFLAGIEKCGTTDLYYSLTQHPHVAQTPMKEPHWWAKARVRQQQSVLQYLPIFDRPSREIRDHVSRTSPQFHPLVTLDGSADTILTQATWRSYGKQLHTIPGDKERLLTYSQMHHVLPDARFVVIVRNPVDRLYSSYNYFPLPEPGLQRRQRHQPKSATDFHVKSEYAIRWFNNCSKTYPTSLELCLFWQPDNDELSPFITHFQMGFYSAIFKQWLATYRQDQFYIVRMEDYSRNKTETVDRIFKFLDLPALPANITSKLNMETSVKNQLRRKPDPMLDETRILLAEFYQPYLLELSVIFNDKSLSYL